tara:strand:- start:841 stop:1275 length:435 start_codon:yes stop_codon:yes gene_type:complete
MTSENNIPKRYLASETTLHLKQSIVCLRFDMKPLNGIIYEAYENGQLMYERNYKDGKEDVLLRGWYEDGQLKYECNVKDGKKDGLERWWHENGQLEYEYNYKDGKKDGLDRTWYENGQLKYECNFKDDLLISEKGYDKDGNLKI